MYSIMYMGGERSYLMWEVVSHKFVFFEDLIKKVEECRAADKYMDFNKIFDNVPHVRLLWNVRSRDPRSDS